MTQESREFLLSYLINSSPTGFEHPGQKLWLDYVKPYCDTWISDPYGSIAAVVNPDAAFKVVIEAHADEIGWFVSSISEKGYINVKRNGGSDPIIAPSKRVLIQTPKGIVRAVFGWPAIHVRQKDKEELPTIKNIFLDVGADSREEVEAMGIHVGCVATFEDEPMFLNKERYLTGRALDNRIGGYMIAEVLRRLKANETNLPFGLYVVNAVQEEIGLRGAEMISRRLKPDVALITDVTHDNQAPGYPKDEAEIRCGKGPVLTYGSAVHNKWLQQIIEVAEKSSIPFQRQVAERSTGTDTDAFAYSGEGVPSALISLPLKYMHTTVETVHMEDVEHVIELMLASLESLKDQRDFSYFS